MCLKALYFLSLVFLLENKRIAQFNCKKKVAYI